MADYWIKLYHEVLDDPKMATMPDDLWRFVIELFLAAGRINKDGELPESKQIAWMMRRTVSDTDVYLSRSIDAGIIAQTDSGYTVINFNKRQSAVSDKDRKYAQRERDHKKEYYEKDQSRECHEVVTNCDIEQNRTDTDTEQIQDSAQKPRRAVKPPAEVDLRKDHPAILAIKTVCKRYPPKQAWDLIIGRLGENPDIGKLTNVNMRWVASGKNPMNYDGITDWYSNGIPDYQTRKSTTTSRVLQNHEINKSVFALTPEEQAELARSHGNFS